MMLALGILIGGFIATVVAVIERGKLERRWRQAWHQAAQIAAMRRNAGDLEQLLVVLKSRWDEEASPQLEFSWDEEPSPQLKLSDEAASKATAAAKLPNAPTLSDIRRDPSRLVLSE